MENITQIFQILTLLWLFALSVVVFWIANKFRQLTKKVKKGNLVNVLEKVLDTEKKNVQNISVLKKELGNHKLDAEFHIQKMSLVRFNPFEEMGGDHSFSVALLDGNDTGIIITGLHTRERTRVYIKDVKKGKTRYELSKEEKRVLAKAQNH